jgi:hypothetical protein
MQPKFLKKDVIMSVLVLEWNVWHNIRSQWMETILGQPHQEIGLVLESIAKYLIVSECQLALPSITSISDHFETQSYLAISLVTQPIFLMCDM